MKSIVVFLAIFGAISARTTPKTNFKVKGFPTGIASDASISNFKFLASIRITNEDLSLVASTGIIISENWVLTAASSVFNKSVETLEVRVGSSSSDNGGQVAKVSQAFIHPEYSQYVIENNVALLKLKENLTLNDKVSPAVLSKSISKEISTAVVAGFGLTLNLSDSRRLRSTNLNLYDIFNKRHLSKLVYSVIHTISNSNSGSALLEWGSPLLVDGAVIGSHVDSYPLPNQRDNSTIDTFTDLTSSVFRDWFVDIIDNN